ncbi:MAG: Asp-tRNA(Asn)/Glu-tRNA(Gln) amidotransferase subunit GatC [Bdellovibrionales bacterium]|nr:Asp-tRNA(Asn)/Glu-tRNA(Gln) amidotransferase subunit GatC [Bdellovibrionales bacterium]
MNDNTNAQRLVDIAEIKRIARLARLDISETDAERFSSDVNGILNYIRKLQELDTETISPLSHVHGSHNVFRRDEQEDYDKREKILLNVPERSGNFIKVPLIIDQESN